MADVARLAGVSSMTVSRALRADAPASEETRKKIREAADQLGYVLNSTAAGLSSRKTGFVAVTIPSINNSNFADTVRGLTDGLNSLNIQVLLGYTDYDADIEEKHIESMLRRRPEAIVVTGGAHTPRARRLMSNAGIPVIEMWDLPDSPIGHVVGFSNRETSRTMCQRLHDKGYRRIGFIGGASSRDTRGADRRRGYEEAMRELGCEPRVTAYGDPPITMRQGGGALAEMLETWPDIDAVLCVSDLSAFGALSECRRRGLQVPGDIAIAGFGNYDLAECAVPSLTTVEVHAEDIGRRVAELVREQLSGETDNRDHVTSLIPFEIIERESA
ncbi:LacI family DNA-binding transcriptional regulator [Pelagibius litoralis]|uniref:LacI family DNA-binding transcriptional regulator n=2 Tax=Pelagibius litoralis TaxID=374515 RepID=A0A967K7Q3_9PROT|nr:LacI family DNA-binding transcriptional regulator [Pelagibius litoralis]